MSRATVAPAVQARGRLELLYRTPVSSFAPFVRRLCDCAEGHAGRFELRRVDDAGALARATRFAAVVSLGLPTIVVMRDGEVIANALGDLPAHELRSILRHAVDSSR